MPPSSRASASSVARSPAARWHSQAQINASIDRAVADVGGSGGEVACWVITGALLATQAAAAILALFLTFFIKDGPAIWRWLIFLLATGRRAIAD